MLESKPDKTSSTSALEGLRRVLVSSGFDPAWAWVSDSLVKSISAALDQGRVCQTAFQDDIRQKDTVKAF